jgi:8-amino-7-oxononanoate synthase
VPSRSTLHAFVDCFTALGPDAPVLADAGAYPIARWGARAAGRATGTFAHHDPDALGRRLRAPGPAPLVVSDGFCPGCGTVAPLDAYLTLVRRRSGLLILDDTQALGVLGARRGREPYGTGGGGSPAWSGVSGPGLVVVASLAKGFGVPVAVVAGERRVIRRVEAAGPSREHTSPPSLADLSAAHHAVETNRRTGDRRRYRLLGLVHRLRRQVPLSGGWFPVQSLPAMPGPVAARVAEALARRGVRAVVQRPLCRPATTTVTLLVTARHTGDQIDRAAAALASVCASHVLAVPS